MADGSRGERDVGFVQSAFMCQRQQQNTFAFLLVLCTQTSHEALRRFSAAISFATNAYQYLAFLCFCLPPIDLGSALHIYGGLCECYHKEKLFFNMGYPRVPILRMIPRINWLTHNAYQYLAFLCFCLPPIDLGSALHIYGGLCECYHKEKLFFNTEYPRVPILRTIPRINWLTHSGSFSCAEVHE
jgi:hypothetical protein